MSGAATQLRQVTIDLTPLLPGGANGGAKLLAISLVRHLRALAPATQFTLLTSAASHAELADLDAPNVGRRCVDADLAAIDIDHDGLSRARLLARAVVNTLLPSAAARQRVKDQVWTHVKRRRRAQVAAQTPADLLFCPFTAPFYYDQRVPLVSLIHDVQFFDHPEFFDDEARAGRQQHFRDATAKADRLVCVSEFVRQTVLAHTNLAPERVLTIHSAVVHAAEPDPAAVSITEKTLASFGLVGQRHLLYPANVWPHKNHYALVDAFALFRKRFPMSGLALVCTGAPGAAADALQTYAATHLPPGSFAFVGFLSEREFGALLQTCRALIFPSLYEGFGLPVLEAMACARPVLCSNTTSLPEVAGDAALLFEPRDPAAIADAIEQLETRPGLEGELVERGRARVKNFGNATAMAARYLAVFEEVVSARRG